jgi:hypothetical protein
MNNKRKMKKKKDYSIYKKKKKLLHLTYTASTFVNTTMYPQYKNNIKKF